MDEVERLADRVMMIRDGRRQLLGSLAEIRSERGDGLLEIEFEGALPLRPEVYDVLKSTSTSATLKSTAGSTDRDVLGALLASSVRIRRFRTAEPSLTDIFIEIYTRKESA
jgi:ABC-2 type transport system ATP-binding protein